MRTTGFIVVVDSYLVRQGILSVLNRIHGVAILHEFQDIRSLKDFLPRHSIDYILINQSLFDESSDIFATNPVLLEKVILLKDGQADPVKPLRPQDPAYNSIYLSDDKDSIVRTITSLVIKEDQANPGAPDAVLSPRESTIVRLISMGLTNRQIADKLFLSAHTVMTHRKNISNKLEIKSVSGLTVYAIVNNLITIEEVTSLPKE